MGVSPTSFTPLLDAPAAAAAALAAWFAGARRPLPWRTDRTAYRVWLSEVMCQQTQVARVVDYFERFVARFPTVQDLAAAHEDEVLSLWSGLGYYSRGRNLHRAAKVVVEDHGGVFPTSSEALRSLPGVGAYTSAAIASLTSGERTAVVDGNVIRVLSRLSDEAGAVDVGDVRARIDALADELVQAARDPAIHNEALMELGALVCTPKSPSCGACPVSPWCAARARGTAPQRPVKSRKTARKSLRVACVVVVVEGRVHLERRSHGGLFRGLWEPVCVEIAAGDDVEAAWATLCVERGVAPPTTTTPIVVERTLTHRDLRFEVAVVAVPAGNQPPRAPVGVEAALFDDDALSSVGISSAVQAVLQAARCNSAFARSPRLL